MFGPLRPLRFVNEDGTLHGANSYHATRGQDPKSLPLGCGPTTLYHTCVHVIMTGAAKGEGRESWGEPSARELPADREREWG